MNRTGALSALRFSHIVFMRFLYSMLQAPEVAHANRMSLCARCSLVFGLMLVLYAQDQPGSTGPLTLVIEYRCLPAKRLQLRDAMISRGLPRLNTLKSTRALDDFLVLFSRYVDSNNWDMLAMLSFRDYAQVASWKAVEVQAPGGFDPTDLELITAMHTYPLDRVRHDGVSPVQGSNTPVYLVIPYNVVVPSPTYLDYVDDYVRPQMDGWIREGVLAHYALYLQRYTAARPWDSLLILHYSNDDALGRRESVVAKVRQQLQNQPVWKTRSESKQSIRTEKEAIVADELRTPGTSDGPPRR
jgi:hypothetical protein